MEEGQVDDVRWSHPLYRGVFRLDSISDWPSYDRIMERPMGPTEEILISTPNGRSYSVSSVESTVKRHLRPRYAIGDGKPDPPRLVCPHPIKDGRVLPERPRKIDVYLVGMNLSLCHPPRRG